MIDDSTKTRFLKELEKSGNVFLSCLKMNIHRSTYYRWKKEDKNFRKKATEAEGHGRENNVDIGEHSLMKKVREGDLGAIKYLLSYNSPRYRPKKEASRVFFMHEKRDSFSDKQAPTLTEAIRGIEEKMRIDSENKIADFDKPEIPRLESNGWLEEESEENNYASKLVDEDLSATEEKIEKPLSLREKRLARRENGDKFP